MESVECLVNVIEKYPDLVEKDDNTLRKVVELIFKNMVEIEDQISPEWASPPAGFNDDCLEDDDQKIIKIQMDSIDKLLGIVGPDRMVQFLEGYLKQMFDMNNWKYTHAAVMTISQIGEYLEDETITGPYVDILEQ